jgi:hypothetical protein
MYEETDFRNQLFTCFMDVVSKGKLYKGTGTLLIC